MKILKVSLIWILLITAVYGDLWVDWSESTGEFGGVAVDCDCDTPVFVDYTARLDLHDPHLLRMSFMNSGEFELDFLSVVCYTQLAYTRKPKDGMVGPTLFFHPPAPTPLAVEVEIVRHPGFAVVRLTRESAREIRRRMLEMVNNAPNRVLVDHVLLNFEMPSMYYWNPVTWDAMTCDDNFVIFDGSWQHKIFSRELIVTESTYNECE